MEITVSYFGASRTLLVPVSMAEDTPQIAALIRRQLAAVGGPDYTALDDLDRAN